ncbi:unnamed protein product [Adineta ricciae]|uniref:Uncharacterized protein n=1 Tax=Adineta ricciae TaxID=249248 RepID=A0A814IRU0_ADIRI|nr:unnamed protein product [Adineta ricciae]
MEFVRRYRLSFICFVVLPYVFFIYSFIFGHDRKYPVYLRKPADTGRVLVIYVWADTDVQSLGNLEFLIRHGVRAAQNADYYFILQKFNNTPLNRNRLPRLPINAHYIEHDNECFDFGTFGWFLGNKFIKTMAYFDHESMWWYNIYTKLLTDEVKLAGSTINCEHKPHVQSYLLVTDQIGLAILTDKKTGVFNCKKDYSDAVFNGEIGASQSILHANYQIASLQTKYQGVDFRKKENWQCNHQISPIFVDRSVDSISHDPFELVFVKYKGQPAQFDTDLERRAMIYEKWIAEQPAKKPKPHSTVV